MRLAGAGDDLSLSHAKIGRRGIASRTNAAHTKADNACCEGKPDKTPNKGAHGRILIALPCIVPTLRETTMPERRAYARTGRLYMSSHRPSGATRNLAQLWL